ncbi:hypothetical protein [Lacticaseibacillus suihuaensis]
MGLFRLELKKQPWLLHMAGLVALTLLFCVPLGHQLGILQTTYSYTDGMRHADYEHRTAAAAHHEMVTAQKSTVLALAAQNKTVANKASSAALAAVRAIKAPLLAHQYLAVDRILLDVITRYPELVYRHELYDLLGGPYISGQVTAWESATKRLRYATQHGVNHPLTSDDTQSSTVATYNVFSRYGSYVWKRLWLNGGMHVWYKINPGTALVWLFLTYATLVLASVFNFDRRHRTENLMRLTPRGDLGMIVTRAAVTVALIGAVAIGFTLLGNAANAIVPGHIWGSWFYPLVTVAHSTAYISPVWQYIGSELLLLMLWVFVLSGFTFIFSQVVRNLLLLLALDALTFLAVPLHLMELLPPAVQKLTPAFYTNPPALFAQDQQFRGIVSLVPVWLVFVGWGVAAWVFGAFLLRSRTRGYWRRSQGPRKAAA